MKALHVKNLQMACGNNLTWHIVWHIALCCDQYRK